MGAKAIIVLCFQAAFAQSVFSQCVGPIGLAPAALAYDGLGLGAGCAPFTPSASAGGSFVVTSASPIAPTGVTVVSENVYEGSLIVGGNLPLLGSVGLEGEFPTAGAGAVSYGCGDSAVGIVAEEGPIATGIVAYEIAAPGYALAAGYGPVAPFGYGLAYGPGFGFGYGPGAYGLHYGTGCGCGAIY